MRFFTCFLWEKILHISFAGNTKLIYLMKDSDFKQVSHLHMEAWKCCCAPWLVHPPPSPPPLVCFLLHLFGAAHTRQEQLSVGWWADSLNHLQCALSPYPPPTPSTLFTLSLQLLYYYPPNGTVSTHQSIGCQRYLNNSYWVNETCVPQSCSKMVFPLSVLLSQNTVNHSLKYWQVFQILVKYTHHKAYLFWQFFVYSTMALSTFALLGSCHHHPSPGLSFPVEILYPLDTSPLSFPTLNPTFHLCGNCLL